MEVDITEFRGVILHYNLVGGIDFYCGIFMPYHNNAIPLLKCQFTMQTLPPLAKN